MVQPSLAREKLHLLQQGVRSNTTAAEEGNSREDMLGNPTLRRSQRAHITQGAHDPNSLLHGGFAYLESGINVRVPLLPDDRGRRHLTVADSATEKFRPSRRVLTPGFSGSKHPRVQGLARVDPVLHSTPREGGLRTNAIAAGRSGYDAPDPGLELQTKHMVMDATTGRPARERLSGELTLEKSFGVKRKINSQRAKRGGVPAKGNPGDKLFHHVDYSPGFHQAGEFTVGSSFYRSMPRGGTRGVAASAGGTGCGDGGGGSGLRSQLPDAVVPDDVGYALGYRKPRMSFQESRQALQYLDDLRGVLELTEAAPPHASGVGEEQGISWEQKTGMHTWPRKADAATPGEGEAGELTAAGLPVDVKSVQAQKNWHV